LRKYTLNTQEFENLAKQKTYIYFEKKKEDPTTKRRKIISVEDNGITKTTKKKLTSLNNHS
jgi:hypothetical protein